MRTFVTAIAIALAACSFAACGKGGGSAAKKDDAGSATPAVAPLVMPALGVDAPKRMNFIYDVGAPAYDKAVTAYKAKPRDWPGVRAGCEAALLKDPTHLDAHRLLASALAQTGEHAAAVDHLVTALAADYYKYGPSIAKDDDLKDFLATPHGQAVTALSARIADEYAKRAAAGVWVLARRSPFKWPAAAGTQQATTRGELYAYDRDAKRYLRLTHTDHQLAGVVRAASGAEVALIGFDKVERPADKTDKKKPADDAAPLIARAWVQAVDPKTWLANGARITVPPAREISVGYGAGDDLLIEAAPAKSRWTLGLAQVLSVDRSTGKVTVTDNPPPPLRVALTLDEGRLIQSATGIDATWAGEPPTAPSFKTAAGAAITVPESGATAQASIAIAPGGAHVSFATNVDPCAKDAAPSLYVADAKSGALKHVLTAKSRFATRWIDATTLAYEDGDGAIRLWDSGTGRELLRLDDKAGLALDVLSGTSAPICKQAPPAIEPAGSDEPLPPEDSNGSAGGGGGGSASGGGGGASGPVTTP